MDESGRGQRRDPGRAHTLKQRPHANFEGVLLRREAAGGGALLLKHPARETVYRYDPAAKALGEATDAEWQRAAGPVAECGKQLLRSHPDVRIDARSHRLMAGGREVSTAGRYAFTVIASPGGRWAAVVSAAGPEVFDPLPVPFFPNDYIEGQRYLELMSLPDLVRHGEPIRISHKTPMPFWSADDQFIVLLGAEFFHLSVVETGLPTASHP